MSRFETASPLFKPGDPARLAWLFALLLSPFSGIAYVEIYGLHGGKEALSHLSLLLLVSLAISSLAAITAPFQNLDRDTFTRAARHNLLFAVLVTIAFALLLLDPSSTAQNYPLGWLALAGMH